MSIFTHNSLSAEDRLFNRTDSTSFSNAKSATVTHIDINWSVDFSSRCLEGSAIYTVDILNSNITHIDLDCTGIDISDHGVSINEYEAGFATSPSVDYLGCRLSVEIPKPLQSRVSTCTLSIHYKTRADSTAVQWLEPANTKGGTYPYVFTQCCLSHARSLLPCMDTPSVKATYRAIVTCPLWCTVLMSALFQSKHVTDTHNVFEWHQPIPIPSYLVALAAGNLTSQDISPRVRVWSEPEMISAAHHEFAETEQFLTAAESITGVPYAWSRYDLLCLPPAFPKGGMENPCLTFATPTLLAGDRSLVNIVAHEIAHSWTGNLVTNTTWNHFWLNEGLTTWLERKILGRVREQQLLLLQSGSEPSAAKAAGDEYFRLCAQGGMADLRSDLSQMISSGNERFTALVWPLEIQNPDDAYSNVPYEKGFALLHYLETLVGSELFASFVGSYINRYKFRTITSGEFRDYFVECVSASSDGNAKAAIASLDWHTLLLGTGPPSHPLLDLTTSMGEVPVQLAQRWMQHFSSGISVNAVGEFSSGDVKGWCSLQTCLFLDCLLTHHATQSQVLDTQDDDTVVFDKQLLQLMDNCYGFTGKPHNAEIKFRWFSLCIRCECEWVVPGVVAFVTEIGRMKFIRPLYRHLLQSGEWTQLAIDTFERNKYRYHPIARKMIQKDVEAAKAQK